MLPWTLGAVFCLFIYFVVVIVFLFFILYFFLFSFISFVGVLLRGALVFGNRPIHQKTDLLESPDTGPGRNCCSA